MDFFNDFMGQQGFLPHAYCLTWTPGLLWTMVIADALTVMAYFSIPAFIVTFVRKRQDLQYRWLWIVSGVLVFGSCGTGHLWDVWVTWVPDYYEHAAIKVFTAVVSLGSAIVLWPLLPRLLAIPSSRQLQDAITQLESEVAKRKTAEEHLLDTELSLSATLGMIGAGFISADADGRILRMNPVAERLTGWTAAEAEQRLVSEVVTAVDARQDIGSVTRIAHLSSGGDTTTAAFALARRGGGVARVRLTSTANRDERGEVRGMAMLIIDETELKAAEKEVGRLAAIVESTSDAIVSSTPEGTITSWNQGAQELFGFRAAEALGKDIAMLVPDALQAEAAELAVKVMSGERVPHFDTQRLRRGGERVDVAITLSPVRDAGGEVVGYSAIASDVTERRRAQADLRESQTRLSYALDAAQLGTWEMDTTTGTFERSLRHDECYGYDTPQPVWTIDTYYRAIHPDDRDEVYADWQRTIFAEKRQWARELRILWPDQTEHWVSVCAGVIEEPSKPMRVIGVIGDITQRKQAEQALLRASQLEAENRRVIEDRYTAERERRRAAEALAESQQSANRAKTEFLATINHELRTPLNGILGMAELARSPDVEEGVRRGYLNQIVISGKEMSELMGQVLDMTRIESGRMELENVIFDLSTLLTSMRNTYAPIAAARGLDFHYRNEGNLPRMVFGDPVRLRQIINNLVANALKFTLRGSVTLAARQIAANRYRFEVTDTGIGIEAEALGRLFQPYSQGSSDTQRDYGGTGLGLYICKQLAQLMQGDVGVRSQPDEGSVFWADIELSAVTMPLSPGTVEEAPLPDVSGLRVLVVDDNVINREVVSTMLERAQAVVTQATNGREAVDAVAASSAGKGFDAVLMDMRMPVMGGIEATRLIRTLKNGADLPIIAFTADTMNEDRQRVFEAGANDLLAKPIDKQKLFERLHAVVRGDVADGLRPASA
ncbi:MAG: PAS domain S-box protein [Rhodocyclaceae bacterium]|nr:PAS domain S-box protein [Rhodocyclaceae bacterium]